MKFQYNSWCVLLLLLVFASCQKVIDVDLNTSDPKYVVEGTILNGDTTQVVKITRTLNFDESVAYPAVNDAVVTVTDDLGNTANFVSIGNGMYQLTNYPGVPERTYTITVSVNGSTFIASSKMPAIVPIDSLYVQEFLFGQDTFRSIVAARFDPINVPNYFQLHVFQNQIIQKGVIIQDDQFTDGNYDVQPVFVGDLKVGDTVRVDLFGIDKPVWSYFNQLSVNTNGSGATPANPTSNFTGGCLGYFSARTVDSRTIFVP